MIYFAHSMCDYNTKFETQCQYYIQEIFKDKVLNPNSPNREPLWQKQGMKYFDNTLLPQCQGLVFLSMPDGSIGSGVAYEIEAYLKERERPFMKPVVYEIVKKTAYVAPFGTTSLDRLVNPAVMEMTNLVVKEITDMEKLRKRYVSRIETRQKIKQFKGAR